MRQRRKTVMMILVLALFPLPACHEPVVGPEVNGKAVSFTARTGLGNLTKTEYKNVVYNGIELMEWKDKDPIRVASPEAKVYDKNTNPWGYKTNRGSGTTVWSDADYLIVGSTISNHSNESISEAKVENPDATNGLQWGADVYVGTSGDPYHFYGIYPGQDKKSISFTSVTASQADIAASLPADQTKSGNSAVPTAKPDSLVLPPDMEFAYMRAYAEVPWNGSGAAPDLPLDFYPMITTFQVTVGGDPDNTQDDLTLSRVELVSSSCRLAGAWTTTVTGDTRSDVSYVSEALATGKQDTVRLYMPTESAPKISRTKQLTFTFFVLPKGVAYDSTLQSDKQNGVTNNDTAITDLSLRFQVSGKFGGSSTVTKKWLSLPLKIKDNYTPTATDKLNINARRYVEFPAGRKINIKNITLPLQLNPWTFSVSATDLEEEISDVAVNPVQVQSWEHVDPVDPLDKKIFSVTYNGVTTTSEGTEVRGQDIEVTSYPNPGMPPSPGYVGGVVPPSSGFEVNCSPNLGGFNVEITGGASWYLNYGTTNRVMVKLAYNNDIDDGTDPGMGTPAAFSISDSKYGYFSPGNLQYRASTGTWRFAEHQWDYVGGYGGYNGSQQVGTVYEGGVLSDNTLVSPTYDGWIDLFGWGTSGYNGWAAGDYGSARSPWSTDPDIDYLNYGPTDKSQHLTGAFANGDWGYNTIMSGSVSVPGGTYRTLTDKEWEHLIDGRVTNDAGKCSFLKARINPAVGHYRMIKVTFRGVDDPSYAVTYMIKQPAGPINGLLLFPDGIDKTDAQVSGYTTMNTKNAAYADVTWDAWKALQARGCVFLPAAGRRGSNTSGTVYVNNLLGFGYYHSASRIDSPADGLREKFSVRCYFYKDENSGSVNSNVTEYKSSTASVRLVREEAKSSAGTSSYVIGGNPF